MKVKPYLIFAILSGAIISFCDDQLDQEKTSQEKMDEYNEKARDEFQKEMNVDFQRKCSESLEKEEKKSNQNKQKNNDYKGWRVNLLHLKQDGHFGNIS